MHVMELGGVMGGFVLCSHCGSKDMLTPLPPAINAHNFRPLSPLSPPLLRSQVAADFRVDVETLSCAVSFFDRVISVVQIPSEMFQIAAMACIFIGEFLISSRINHNMAAKKE